MTEIRIIQKKKSNNSNSNNIKTNNMLYNGKGERSPTEWICQILKILSDKFIGLF